MQQAVLSFADLVVRSPLVRWTWSGLSEQGFGQTLSEYRPSDIETVHEMMAGRYLLASKLVDTQGVSPFAIAAANDAWRQELHGFSWLRHFREARGDAEKRFARTLVMDWICRNAQFDARNWALELTSIRVLNWLRRLPLLLEGATPEQAKAIKRSLNTQLQSLKLRGGLSANPLEGLFAAIALLGAALCDDSNGKTVRLRLDRVRSILGSQIDRDGLHKSRNAAVQFALLTELVSVRQALGQRHSGLVERLGAIVDKMHQALDTLTLGNGELAYFNGCGQMPVELLITMQAQHNQEKMKNGSFSGYGVLSSGPATLIADSGLVPPPALSRDAHAGGLSFELTHGSDLVVGNCGPAPADLTDNRTLFRQGVAHSGPTIDGMSSARLVARGPHTGQLIGISTRPQIAVDSEEASLEIVSSAYLEKYGVQLKRSMTLIADGDTLVGQDMVLPNHRKAPKGVLSLRFHLAPGAQVERQAHEDIVLITLKSGAQWTFLWEGGTADLDDSVRQSAYFGFFRTKQIVVEVPIGENTEISWIFTRQNS